MSKNGILVGAVMALLLAANLGFSQSDKHFGEKINKKGAITYEALYTQLSNADSVQAKVVGTVEKVCQKKGCWMTILPEEAGKEPLLVQFKDYGFFMPKDLSGKRVVMEGYAYREVTPVDVLRHYAEDAGKSQEEIEKITEPKEELKFLASGVLILKK